METQQFRTDNQNIFSEWWAKQPSGTIVYKVRCIDGNTGKWAGSEWSTNREDLQDMQSVSDGYFTETSKLIRK